MDDISVETIKKVGRVEEQIRNIEELGELMTPLVNHLLPISQDLDISGVPCEGRQVRLKCEDWSKQYEGGVNRCLGFNILWE